MAKKAEYDAAAAAAGEAAGERKQLPPVRTIRGQLCQFEQSMVSHFDRLEGRMNIFEA